MNIFDSNAGPTTDMTNIALKIEEIRPNKFSGLTTLTEALNKANWPSWSKRITSMFKLCQVKGYVKGSIDKPPNIDPKSARNWATNDVFA